jgi:hypothetical protein
MVDKCRSMEYTERSLLPNGDTVCFVLETDSRGCSIKADTDRQVDKLKSRESDRMKSMADRQTETDRQTGLTDRQEFLITCLVYVS